jgi:hypothetical protein
MSSGRSSGKMKPKPSGRSDGFPVDLTKGENDEKMDDPWVPSGYVKIAIEYGHRNSEFFPMKNCDFP